VCTVLLRFDPDAGWPLLLAAVRDEFVDRAWDPPGQHWPQQHPSVTGGRDRLAGGTWLAVRREAPAVAAILNGKPLPPAAAPRPSRGGLPLALLTDNAEPDLADLRRYDAFHLLLATPHSVRLWSWDGTDVRRQDLPPGDHIAVNLGLDTVDDPLVPHFGPLLRGTPSPALKSDVDTPTAWDGWVDLLRGDGLPGDDPRALLVRHVHEGRIYGSTSASLVAIGRDRVRLDFTAMPSTPSWYEVPVP
jgi:hypothetical protein